MKLQFLAILVILSSCSKVEKTIVHEKDYLVYLNGNNFKFTSEDETLRFWQKRFNSNNEDQTSIVKLANLHAARFKTHGDITDIILSDSLFALALKKNPMGNAGIFQGLAANAITQHQFKKADEYLREALNGENKATTYLMLADVRMELGDLQGAKSILNDFKNKNSFAFLIRDAKIKDKEGKLDTAIIWMEKGLQRVGSNKSLYCWTKSNLADMYGHAGRIADSYNDYLDVLKADPSYLYALKGIAWVAFSHDHNYKEAKRIIRMIQSKRPTPDLYLLLAEIAHEENDPQTRMMMLEKFMKEVSNPLYGDMYNKYLILLMAEDLNMPLKAIEIARKEIESRATTECYDLLAWSLFKNGEVSEALRIATMHVEGKTFEPEALYHLGEIYKKADIKKSRVYLEEALSSSFELGPSLTRQIKESLENSLTF